MKRGMEFRRAMMIMVVVRARFMVMIVFRLMSMIGMRMVGFMGLFMCREAAAGLPLSGTDGGILGFCARRCGWFIFFHRSLLIQFDLPAGRCDAALASSTLECWQGCRAATSGHRSTAILPLNFRGMVSGLKVVQNAGTVGETALLPDEKIGVTTDKRGRGYLPSESAKG